MKRWLGLAVAACAWSALLAQPPEDQDQDRGPPPAATPPVGAGAQPAPPPGPSLQACRSKVLTPREKAYCCATYPQLRRACT